jgi:calcium/calmodulin-dependent protein kinase I
VIIAAKSTGEAEEEEEEEEAVPLDRTLYACKVIDRTKLQPESDRTVFRELAILRDIRELDHITQLKDCFVTPTTVHVVQTYCRGGDVFDKITQRSTTYTEHDARDLAKTLLQVMELLHLRKLAHRDLKPENLLLKNRMRASEIVVADFGMAQYVPLDGFLKTRCGTYMHIYILYIYISYIYIIIWIQTAIILVVLIYLMFSNHIIDRYTRLLCARSYCRAPL